MRKIINKMALVMLAFASVTATSCLKDEGFDNGEYGSVTGNTEGQQFVSVPASSRAKNSIAIGVVRQPGIQTFKLFAVSYDAADRAPEDFTATFTLNNDVVTQNYPSATIVPASIYTIPSFTVNFKKGDRLSDSLRININTETLDPNLLYGLGFTLTSVSKAGVQIASNLRNVVVLFPVKNKYDGVYTLKGIHTRSPYQFRYVTDVHLVTTSANSVEFYWPLVSSVGHPIAVGPGNALNWYGPTVAPEIIFDPTTDFVTNVRNTNVAGPPIDRLLVSVGTDPRFVVGDAKYIPAAGPNPAMITVYWRYNANNDRGFLDTLYRVGPRP